MYNNRQLTQLVVVAVVVVVAFSPYARITR